MFDEKAGTFLSRQCAGLQSVITTKFERLRRLGYRPRSEAEFWEDVGIHMRSAGPEPWRRQMSNAAGLIEARRNGLGGGRGSSLGKSLMAAAWEGRVAHVEIVQCLSCDKLLMMATAGTAKPKYFHRACWEEILRTDDGRAWARERDRLHRTGRSAATIRRMIGEWPPLPTRRPGRRRDPAAIKRNFGWAVRHYLGGLEMRQIAEDEDVDPSEVSHRVHDILQLLPDPELVYQRFAKYVVALRASAATRRE